MPYDEDPKAKPKAEPKGGPDEEKNDEKKVEHYAFLRETIKTKEVSREKFRSQLARLVLYGLLFGIFASLGFFALKPWVQRWFQEDPQTVTIPIDEELESDDTAEENPAESGPPVLTAESYQDIMNSMLDIATQASRGVALIKGVDDQKDWTENEKDAVAGVSGLIVGDNGQELLLLADNSVCADYQSWTVTFSDQSQYRARLKKQDKNRGLAIFGVLRSDISSKTWEAIELVTLGNSNVIMKGEIVIAIGNILGTGDGIAYGILSSNQSKASLPDGKYSVLATDISVSPKGTGGLFNQKGEVIGLIVPGTWQEESSNTANALAISDLKSVIGLLVNGESVPYLGIYGATVTDEVVEAQGLPRGVYVTQVKTDSPAMKAGIQNGDIIVQVNNREVMNTQIFERAVLTAKVGEEIILKGKRLGANGYVDIEFTVLVESQE